MLTKKKVGMLLQKSWQRFVPFAYKSIPLLPQRNFHSWNSYLLWNDLRLKEQKKLAQKSVKKQDLDPTTIVPDTAPIPLPIAAKKVKVAETLETKNAKIVSFQKTSLLKIIKEALEKNFPQVKSTTPVQFDMINELLSNDNDVLCASETGSGKTLAYALPLIHKLKMEELLQQSKQEENKTEKLETTETTVEKDLTCDGLRKPNRPRMIVVVPSKELAGQTIQVIKLLSHVCKLKTVVLRSDGNWKRMKENLNQPVDIVVATPNTLIEFHEEKWIFFSNLRYLVFDEADTLLGKGFQEDVIEKIFKLCKKMREDRKQKLQFIFSLATFHKKVKQFLETELQIHRFKIISSTKVHKHLPNITQEFIEVQGQDKMELLLDVLSKEKQDERHKVMIFCNTVSCCRAVHHTLVENNFKAACFHSEIPPKKQMEEFEKFKSNECLVLVCTDIASRGLDLPHVKHVILFDFPMNTIDYLHRIGRTGRMNSHGKATSLLQKKDMVLAEPIREAVKKRGTFNLITSDKKLNATVKPSKKPSNTLRTISKSSSFKRGGRVAMGSRLPNTKKSMIGTSDMKR